MISLSLRIDTSRWRPDLGDSLHRLPIYIVVFFRIVSLPLQYVFSYNRLIQYTNVVCMPDGTCFLNSISAYPSARRL
jgi:hypothetical protein